MAVCSEVIENPASEAVFEYDGDRRRRRFERKKSKGSSIVEMLVAIFVLGMVLISMLGMFLISRGAIYSKEDETANAVALRYMEELEGRPFTDFTGSFSASKNFGNKYIATATVVSHDQYMAEVQVNVEWEAAMMGKKKTDIKRVISAGGHKNVGQKEPN